MKNSEFVPDRRHNNAEIDLPSMGSEFPGIPSPITNNPQLSLKKDGNNVPSSDDDFNDQKEPYCFKE